MKCPFCNTDNSSIVDTRSYDTVVIRKHKCRNCGKIFQTNEEIISFEDKLKLENILLKKDGNEIPLDPKGKTFIYFVKASNGLIKIGITNDMEIRFKNLKMMSPCMISLVKCVEGNLTMESKIHKKFNHLRQHGEWFLESDDLLDFIKSITDKIPI